MKIKTKKAPAKVAKTSSSAKSKKVVSKRKSKRKTPRRPAISTEAVAQIEMASLEQQAQEVQSFIEQQKIEELFKALESLDDCTKTEEKSSQLTENDIVAVESESLFSKIAKKLNSWKGIALLSVLATIITALIVSTLFAAERIEDVRVLAQKVTAETKLTVVVYTLASDPRSKPLFSLIEQYEQQDETVKFFIAPIENAEMFEFFKLFGINTIPTMIFSFNGEILASVTGQAATVEDLARVIKQVKDSLKKGKANGK